MGLPAAHSMHCFVRPVPTQAPQAGCEPDRKSVLQTALKEGAGSPLTALAQVPAAF